MYSPRNRTSWDKYMLKDISKYNFYGRSQFVRLRGKYTHQCTHCALKQSWLLCSHLQSPPSWGSSHFVAMRGNSQQFWLRQGGWEKCTGNFLNTALFWPAMLPRESKWNGCPLKGTLSFMITPILTPTLTSTPNLTLTMTLLMTVMPVMRPTMLWICVWQDPKYKRPWIQSFFRPTILQHKEIQTKNFEFNAPWVWPPFSICWNIDVDKSLQV